jgi:hypothetical protein
MWALLRLPRFRGATHASGHDNRSRGGDRGSAARLSSPSPSYPLPRMLPHADHPHTIDRWDDATGENLIEQIAAVGDYLVALATYRAAVRRWPKDK